MDSDKIQQKICYFLSSRIGIIIVVCFFMLLIGYEFGPGWFVADDYNVFSKQLNSNKVNSIDVYRRDHLGVSYHVEVKEKKIIKKIQESSLKNLSRCGYSQHYLYKYIIFLKMNDKSKYCYMYFKKNNNKLIYPKEILILLRNYKINIDEIKTFPRDLVSYENTALGDVLSKYVDKMIDDDPKKYEYKFYYE